MSKHGPTQVGGQAESPVIKTLVYPKSESDSNVKHTVGEDSKPSVAAGNNSTGGDERPAVSFVVMVTMALAELGGTATSQVFTNFTHQIHLQN